MTERDRRIERLEDVEREVVLPLCERLKAEFRAVEVGEGHGNQESEVRSQRSEVRGQRSEYPSRRDYLV